VDGAQEVPGTAPENCGYYRMHNLELAKWYAREFAAYLEANADNRDIFEYPRAERLVTEDGQHFFDS
jgi:S-ribosylhomocysteine lyase